MRDIDLQAPSGNTRIRVGGGFASDQERLAPSAVLIVDENVRAAHPGRFRSHPALIVPSGEAHKTPATAERLCRALLDMGADRSALLVGVGGGLATDVAGYVASTYMRGLRFGFISTTLLGQVDASIGGKNGVNLDGYKNVIGTIRQPEFVLCDLDLLGSLPRREFVSGIAEAVKYGAIGNIAFLTYLEEHMDGLLGMDRTVLEHVVATSVQEKVRIVEADEQEGGLRRLLNFGHTLGHAIERNGSRLHGEAVSLGMVLAARLSVNLGLLTGGELDRLSAVLHSAGLPVSAELDPRALFDNLLKDKKKSGKDIHFVVLEGLGRASVRTLPLTDLKSLLHDLC
ncbi:MAG: 3-dehydroquinate synthase [Bacteroidales bacterium]